PVEPLPGTRARGGSPGRVRGIRLTRTAEPGHPSVPCRWLILAYRDRGRSPAPVFRGDMPGQHFSNGSRATSGSRWFSATGQVSGSGPSARSCSTWSAHHGDTLVGSASTSARNFSHGTHSVSWTSSGFG